MSDNDRGVWASVPALPAPAPLVVCPYCGAAIPQLGTLVLMPASSGALVQIDVGAQHIATHGPAAPRLADHALRAFNQGEDDA